MTGNNMIPAGFGQGAVSTIFQGAPTENLGEGIRGGFGIVGYRGKVWSIKYQGKENPLMRDDGDGARASVEVILLKAAPNIAKIFYENGYVDGSTAPPDCWSTNGMTPDPAASKKQCTTCAGCPQNAWGSKVTDAGKPGKACSDSKRIAVAPLNDIANEMFGGPLLLRCPAASLKDLKMYGDQLQSYGFPYYAVATRISFDIAEAFPKFVFSAMRPLTDDEARQVVELRDDPRVKQILSESVEIVHHEPEAGQAAVPSTPFENGAAPVVPAAAAQPVQQAQPAQPAQAAQVQQPAAPAQPAQTAAPATPAKRPRRTKAEMEAAAAALAAARNGGAAPATPAAQPAQTVAAQPQQPVQPATPAPVQTAAALTEETAGTGTDFDAQLDALLPD